MLTSLIVMPLALDSNVLATNHFVQIRQVMTGANGNANVQFVEMRMQFGGQNLWGNHTSLLFFNAAGAQVGSFPITVDIRTDVGGGTNMSVLFATQAFANLPGAPTPDFIIPAGLLQPTNGKICFKSPNPGHPFPVTLCLSYGTVTGSTEGAGTAAPALPTTGAKSLKRTAAAADRWSDLANNGSFHSNLNSHFAISDAAPVNSFGASGPMSFFSDVPAATFARPHIQAMSNAGVTSGCGVGTYCPGSNVTREQMSIFIIKAMGQTPVSPATGVFTDVPPALFPFSAGFMEKMKVLNITAGCGTNIFCPGSNVTREQMSIFIIKAMNQPPVSPATGVFTDVPPALFPFSAGFMEKMKVLNITAGCGTNIFCPGNNVTREQMAIFLQKAFLLPLPP
jgi:hypothetical protein